MRIDTDQSTSNVASAFVYADEAIVHTTLDGQIVGWSPGAQRMFGYSATEALGRPIEILYAPGAWPGGQHYAARFSREPRQYETVLVGKGGHDVEVRATAIAVHGAGGSPEKYATIYRDIGQERKVERLILCKDAFAGLLETLVNVANEAETPESAIAEGLRLMCRHFGWQIGHAVVLAPGEATRRPVLALHYTESPARFAHFIALAKAIDYARPGGGLVGQVLASGVPVWVPELEHAPPAPRTQALLAAGVRAAYAFPVIANGEVVAVLEFYGDASRPPENALVESIGRLSHTFARMIERQRSAEGTARLAAIVEGARDAIIGRALDGVITSWNPAAERLLGYTAAEAIGQPMAITLPLERRFLVDANNERLRRGEPIAIQESPRVRKDGSTVHTSATISPVRDRHGEVVGAAVILRDITETVEARQLLVQKVQFNGLLQTVTRTANEAATPAAALNECLRLIAEFGHWDAGRLLNLADEGTRNVSAIRIDSLEEKAAARSDAEYAWLSEGGEPLIPGLLSSQDAAWFVKAADFPETDSLRQAIGAGMRSAFGFPVIANGRALAVLEFFARSERRPDALLLENIVQVAGQLARIIERHQFVINMARSERRLRTILDSEPACVKVMDAAGRLMAINRAGLEFLEADSLEEADAHGVLNSIPDEHLPRFLDAMLRTIAGERCNLEYELVGRRGGRRWVETHTAPFVPEEGGEVQMLSVTRDVSDRKRAEERAHHLAYHDAVTGMPNRALVQDRIQVALAHAKRRDEAVGVLIAGIDRFRKVNESFGYDAGDALLREVAGRLGAALREMDTLARLGGDQFAILIDARTSSSELEGVAQKVHAALSEPFHVDGRDVFLSVSTGIACYPGDGTDAHALLEAAERAMNHVKEEGGAAYSRSDRSERGAAAVSYGIEAALHQALARGELEVHYQPQVELATGRIVGCEALLRWDNPEHGSVSPARFIPIAEETGLIVPIGSWVLETACVQAAAWHRAGYALTVAVNLSPRQFRQDDLPGLVRRALSSSGLPARYLEIEITESTAMTNPERAARVLRELHELGVKLAVDDFGTGYSSLSYLRHFPLQCLKIDRSFVRDICTSPSDDAIVRATIALAHSLQLEVVGEGVEDRAQHERLLELGCDEGQGFLYAKPMPPAQIEALLRDAA